MTGRPASADPASIDGEAPGTGVQRLPFIDGVRGTAALIVMIGHLIFFVPSVTVPTARHAGAIDFLVWPFRFSGEMVYLFLLVSGFSLYYSELVRRDRGRPASTYREFAARRLWRIGPVYYVAVALGMVSVWVTSTRLYLRPENQVSRTVSVGGFISHLFFVHNLHATWVYQVNGPLWSIAYEVQLYLLFPLLFWAMRRWNPLLVAVVVVAAVKVISFAHLSFPVFGLARWFVAGALIAEAWHRGIRIPVRISLPLGLLALAVGVCQVPSLQSEYRHDAIWLTAFVFLMFVALVYPTERRNPFAWRWLRWVGLRSYSLYALHFPVLLVTLYVAQGAGLHGWGAAALDVAVGGSVAMLLTIASFRWIEAPSLARVAAVGRHR